jgi:monomeric sarcosine oxidase
MCIDFFLTFSAFSVILNLSKNNDRRQASIVYQQRIVIVGAGIVGLSTAYALLKQGIEQVTVLEQGAVDHRRGTSYGMSRLLRFEYGTDALYSEMVRLSLKRWRKLEQTTKRTLYTPTGLLVLGKQRDNFTQPSYLTLRALELPIQHLSHYECQHFFPQFDLSSYDQFTYNSEAGILHASTCLHTLKASILDLGGKIYEAQRVMHVVHDSPRLPVRLRLQYSEDVLADRLVLALGPWVHRLLGELGLPIRMTRQYLLYFANLPFSSFGLSTFPAFLADELYGFPIHPTDCAGYGPGWFKATSHAFGASVDPDEVPPVDERVITQVKRKLYDLLPALARAKLARVDSCMYDVSPDENFILDYHPNDPRIVFATGLTGHGFKFGPLLGEMLSGLICDTPSVVPMEHFRLARFAQQRLRQTASVA